MSHLSWDIAVYEGLAGVPRDPNPLPQGKRLKNQSGPQKENDARHLGKI